MNAMIERDPMVAHVLSLDGINKGYDLMHAGDGIRSVGGQLTPMELPR